MGTAGAGPSSPCCCALDSASPTSRAGGFGPGHTGKPAIWTIGLVLVNQLGFLAVTRLATLANVLASRADVVAQGLTTYQKAFLIFMLPHSVITISIMTALLLRMSRSAAEQDFREGRRVVADGMRLVGGDCAGRCVSGSGRPHDRRRDLRLRCRFGCRLQLPVWW